MTALDLPSQLTRLPAKTPWLAHLELRFAARSIDANPAALRTALVTNRHQGPLLVQKALYPEGSEVCHAVVLHPPAGIAAGDHLSIDLDVAPGAHAVVSTPSATRWYKSGGRLARQEVHIKLAENAAIEWLPEENLFYEDVLGEQTISIDASKSARFIAWDSFMLGRTARGESWERGEVGLSSRLKIDGRLVFCERGRLEGGDARLDGRAGFSGLRCGATLIALSPAIDQVLVESLAERQPFGPDLMAACSQIEPGLIIMRVLGREAAVVRSHLRNTWASLRPAVIGRPARPLRLWAC
jgi:urease accessory protein